MQSASPSRLFAAIITVWAGTAAAQPQTPVKPLPQAPEQNWAPPLPAPSPAPTTETAQAEPPATAAPAAPPPPPETTTTDTATAAPNAPPPPPTEDEQASAATTLEIYGFTMLDGGYDFGEIGDPQWQDTLRPTKLPSFDDQFGRGGRTFASVRQTRFGVKAWIPTGYHGDLKTTFEFELFGTGVDEGQTTFRLRHAYGDWWQLRAGQTWSPFMDIDVFPNSLEYWGPNGMAFYRNVQLAWMPIQGESRVTVALERPGASPDTGIYTGRIELTDVVARFPLPDLSAEARLGGSWGYVEGAGILRRIKWDDLNGDMFDLSGSVWGWGLSASSNIKLLPRTTLRLQAIYGEAVQNYMNDAGADVGTETTSDPVSPLDGVALPCLGLVAFADINWTKRMSTAVGWSMVWIDNSEAQAPDAFHVGHYALGNLLFHPTEKLMVGGELQYGRRENNSDGFDVNDFKFQISVKYNFSKTFGGI